MRMTASGSIWNCIFPSGKTDKLFFGKNPFFMKNKTIINAGWIIACRIVQAVLALAVTMISARYLGPSNYGLVNYAASLVNFTKPVMQLGLNAILVKELVDRPEQEGQTLGTALCLNVASAVACILGILSFVSITNRGQTDTLIVCGL